MFDTQTKFEDSLFYDVSAWTFPLAFNLNYDFLKESFDVNKLFEKPVGKVSDFSTYAYLIKPHDYNIPAFINYLQEKKGEKITEVLSPTFNLLYEYDLNNVKISHYDLYRIVDERELKHLGIFSDKQDTIKIIEWPQLINIPLSDKLEIYIDYAKNENEREIKFIGSGKWESFNEL